MRYILLLAFILACTKPGKPLEAEKKQNELAMVADNQTSGSPQKGFPFPEAPLPDANKLNCANILATMMTMDCQSIEERCSIPDKEEFPSKTFSCGKGILKYQQFLCQTFPNAMNTEILEKVTCLTLEPVNENLAISSDLKDFCEKNNGALKLGKCVLDLIKPAIVALSIQKTSLVGCGKGEDEPCLTTINPGVVVYAPKENVAALIEPAQGQNIYRMLQSKFNKDSFLKIDSYLEGTNFKKKILNDDLKKVIEPMTERISICIARQNPDAENSIYAMNPTAENAIVTDQGVIGVTFDSEYFLPSDLIDAFEKLNFDSN